MKFIAAWKKDYLHQLKIGRSEVIAARLVKVGLDKIIFERDRDSEFATLIDEAKANRFKNTQY